MADFPAPSACSRGVRLADWAWLVRADPFVNEYSPNHPPTAHHATSTGCCLPHILEPWDWRSGLFLLKWIWGIFGKHHILHLLLQQYPAVVDCAMSKVCPGRRCSRSWSPTVVLLRQVLSFRCCCETFALPFLVASSRCLQHSSIGAMSNLLHRHAAVQGHTASVQLLSMVMNVCVPAVHISR